MSEDSARPLGEWLRERREELGVSLEQAETETRIRLRYLEALETESFDSLPDPVVGRGFLRNYAAYLELDPQAAMSRYSELVAPPEPESVPSNVLSESDSGSFRPVPLHEMPDARSGRGLLIALLVLIGVVLVVAAWWAYPRYSEWIPLDGLAAFVAAETPTEQVTKGPGGVDLSTATRTPTSIAIEISTPSEQTTVEPTQEPSETSQETAPAQEPTITIAATPAASPFPSPTPSSPVYTGIFFELVFTDTSWIQVTTDGVRQFQGELELGTYRSFYAEERLEMRVGNAGAVDVTLNGEKLGTLGAVDEVVDRVFEKVGETVDQATITPSPTPEPGSEPSPTLTPTITPTEIVPPEVATPTASP
ncbi:RodZ domain-containing protein [Chloroflexota bacterium]